MHPSMRKTIPVVVAAALLGASACDGDDPYRSVSPLPTGYHVFLETSMGDMVIELYPDDAPQTVANFLDYVTEGYYDSLVFHRVIRYFVIQSGAYTADLVARPANEPIFNEAANGLSNARGTIAMARPIDPHSATSQFFINVADNPFLDHRDDTAAGYGYCVFGRVVSGMAVADSISAVPTGSQDGFPDVPVTPIVILKATRVFAVPFLQSGFPSAPDGTRRCPSSSPLASP
jgi:peptidyl-prolyl cis-trans isomerase B (cyclophilin B)